MAVLALTLEEEIDSTGTASESVSPEDGTITCTWRTPVDTPVTSYQDVIDTINFFTGSTSTAVSVTAPGRIARTPPAAHPARPTWFCRRVNWVRGKMNRKTVPGGFAVGQASVPRGYLAQLDALLTPNYAVYPIYEFSVTYGPYRWPIAPDGRITVYQGTDPRTGKELRYYWPDRKTTTRYLFADEYKRSCRFPKYAPQNDYVTALQGSFVFRTADGTQPNGFCFTGMPRVNLRTEVVTFELKAVPLRWLLSPNSYIRRFRGLLNQDFFYDSQSDPGRRVFGPGSLLYLSYEYDELAPPYGTFDVVFPGDSQGGAVPPPVQATSLLADVRLSCLHTDRKATNPPAPAWKGDVVDGHNALPWLQTPGWFYYSTTPDLVIGGARVVIPANWMPFFASFPFALLFTDPDAPQPDPFPPPGQGGV